MTSVTRMGHALDRIARRAAPFAAFLGLAFVSSACSSDDTSSNASTATGGANAGGDASSSGGLANGGSAGSGGAGGSAGSGGTRGVDGGMGAAATASVLQHHKNATRDGLYIDPAFTKAKAAGIHLDASFNAAVTGPVYAQPLYFEGGPGGKDLVIVATEQNEVIAFDGNGGAVVWRASLGTPAPRSILPCGNITPLGITGTPVIDAASRTLYVDAMTMVSSNPRHIIHSLSVDTGKTNWSVDVSPTAKFGNVAFASIVQNERGALAFVNGTLYVPYGGHGGDCGNYHGWVVGVSADGKTVNAWATRGQAAGIWAPGGISSDGTSLFVATGNTKGATTWSDGEAVIRLSAGPKFSLATTDYFVPTNWQALDSSDLDMGGSDPVLFDVPGATPSKLAAALGKNSYVYLLNRGNLGGETAPLGVLKVANAPIRSAAAAYRTAKGSYVVLTTRAIGCPSGMASKLVAVKVSATAPPKLSIGWCAFVSAAASDSGSPIVTTTDGTNEAIVWWVGAEIDNKLHAFDGDTGATIFGGGAAADAMGPVQHFQTLIAAKGRIFVAGNNALYAFTL